MRHTLSIGQALLLTIAVILTGCDNKPTPNTDAINQATNDELAALAMEAYVWGMPLHMSEQSRKAMTNVTQPDFKGGRFLAPMNQISVAWQLLDPAFTAVPSPNNDTLYVVAFMDLSDEPQILEIPDTKGRFYTFQFIDAYTNNFHYASQKTQGFKQQTYAIVGPDFNGELPEDIPRIDSPTPTIFVIGRLLVNGTEDVPAVNALQQQVHLTPLSQWGTDYQPPEQPLVDHKQYSGELAFWEELGDLMLREKPPVSDLAYLEKFTPLGLSADKGFDAMNLSDEIRAALIAANAGGIEHIRDYLEGLGNQVNGWRLPPVMEDFFGNNYYLRAALADCCLYLNDPDEAYYPPVFTDINGDVLDGQAGAYTLTFPAGQTPPVDAFWSVTMYRASDRLLIPNSINRYKISSVKEDLIYAEDGSLTLYIQKDSPGAERAANWLPAPNEEFYLLMRLYLPHQSILNGEYIIPPITKEN